MLCQLDGGLTAELDDAGVGLLGGNDVVHALRVQGVEVEAVTGVKVGGDGLRVVVDQNGLTAVLLQRPDAMDRAVVELDALTDADGAGAENEHLLLVGVAALGNELLGLVILVVGGVEIRRLGGKFRGAGVDHLEGGLRRFGQGVHARQAFDGLIQETEPLRVQIFFRRQFAGFQAHFNVGQVLQFVQEPPVNLGNVINYIMTRLFPDLTKGIGRT